jgi:hypothetical protein
MTVLRRYQAQKRAGGSLSADRGFLFLAASLTMALIFTFGHYMHERYVVPVLVMLLFAYAHYKDKRLLLIALLFTVLVSAVILVLSHLSFGQKDAFELHITVPETLQFAGAFDDLFAKYTNSHRLVKTRTTNMGSLYKLSYAIELKDPTASQAFMDELRCRNGNLEILICEKMEGSDSL